MSRYLVTGGAGFIGSNIVDALVSQGHEVRVIDSLITGSSENLGHLKERVELVVADIREYDKILPAFKGIDYCLHQAALRSVPKSVDDPRLTHDININGTFNVLMAARQARVRRVVYASSSSVYGDAKHFPQRESDPLYPLSPYATSKLAGEYYGYTFGATMGLEVVSLRYFNVYGPRQNPESKYSAVIPAFIARLLEGQPPVVDGDGQQSRDFTYVGDVVTANLRAATQPGIGGAVINVACGTTTSVLDLAERLCRLVGVEIRPVFGERRAGDALKTQADITALKEKLQFTPQVNLDQGLRLTLEWFQKCQKSPHSI